MKHPGISLLGRKAPRSFLLKQQQNFTALETLLQYTPETLSLWRTITLN